MVRGSDAWVACDLWVDSKSVAPSSRGGCKSRFSHSVAACYSFRLWELSKEFLLIPVTSGPKVGMQAQQTATLHSATDCIAAST